MWRTSARPPTRPIVQGFSVQRSCTQPRQGFQQLGASPRHSQRSAECSAVSASCWRCAIVAQRYVGAFAGYRTLLPLTSGHGRERVILRLTFCPQVNCKRPSGDGGTADLRAEQRRRQTPCSNSRRRWWSLPPHQAVVSYTFSNYYYYYHQVAFGRAGRLLSLAAVPRAPWPLHFSGAHRHPRHYRLGTRIT